MKRTALRRYTSLKAHKRINPVSEKQKDELKLRHELKARLIAKNGEHCMTCKDRRRDWRGISLSHIKALSQGGKTNRDNCILECFPCHDEFEKHPERREAYLNLNKTE